MYCVAFLFLFFFREFRARSSLRERAGDRRVWPVRCLEKRTQRGLGIAVTL